MFGITVNRKMAIIAAEMHPDAGSVTIHDSATLRKTAQLTFLRDFSRPTATTEPICRV